RKLYDPKGAYQIRANNITHTVAWISGLFCVIMLINLTGDLLFGWSSETAGGTIGRLVAAGIIILVGMAIGAMPVLWIGQKLSSAILSRLTFRPPEVNWS